MACDTCIKINPLPECLADEAAMTLTGITFIGTVATVLITDTATGRNTAFDTLEITDLFPLMNHTYEMQFFDENLEKLSFTINGEDGCCIEFGIIEGLTWDGGDFTVSTTVCDA